MSKNYKVVQYTTPHCVPCDNVGTYPSSSAAAKGYEYEIVELSGKYDERKPYNLVGYPWFALQDKDESVEPISDISGSSIVDSFYGYTESRFDILINK
jgi:hypothetical protein